MSSDSPTPEVLIVSHDFPPHGGGGVIRAVKFARYLPSFGWHPVVIAADPQAYDVAYHDPSLSKLGVEAVRVRYPHRRIGRSSPGSVPGRPGLPGISVAWLRRLARTLLVPDPEVLWVIPALIALEGLRRQDRPQVVLTTSPPNSSHLVGWLAKGLWGLPWIADFRDQWVGNPLYLRGPVAQAVERWLEERCLSRADAVLATTPELTRVLAERSSRAVECLRNGFDPEDFRGLSPSFPAAFTLAHVGSLGPTRDPRPILSAWRALAADHPGRVQLRLIGPAHQCDVAGLLREDPLLSRTVVHLPFLPHREALAEMVAASALLLVTSAEEGASTAIPGKTYEYLASAKPIVALTLRGPLARLLQERGLGDPIAPADVGALERELRKLYAIHEAGALASCVPAGAAEPFDRRYQAARLAQILQTALSSPASRTSRMAPSCEESHV